jgi:TonB family protein
MSTWRILAVAAAAVVIDTVHASAEPYLTAEQVRQMAIAMPKPVYPESALHRGITGSGVFKLYVHAKTGRLRSVKILRRTGNRELDAAAVWTLLQWRFKPGVLRTMRQVYPPSKEPDADKDACVCVPISFVLTRAGAQVHWDATLSA